MAAAIIIGQILFCSGPQIGIDYNNQPHSAMLQPDIRQVTVLKKEDWERIQYQLNKRTIEQEKIRGAREAKERLHQLSKERVKNWSNTIVVSHPT